MKYGLRLAITLIVTGMVLFSQNSLAWVTADDEKSPLEATMAEKGFRLLAIRVVAPEYPATSVGLHSSGICVAKIGIDVHGNLVALDILEAPDPEIAASVTKALRQWQFRFPAELRHVAKVQGKITYYFMIKNNHPAVYSATEEFYAGPQAFHSVNKYLQGKSEN